MKELWKSVGFVPVTFELNDDDKAEDEKAARSTTTPRRLPMSQRRKKRITVMIFSLVKKFSNKFHSNRFFEEVDQKLRFKNQKKESYLGVKSHM